MSLALPGSPSVPLTTTMGARLRVRAASSTAESLRATGNAAPPRPRRSTCSAMLISCSAVSRGTLPKTVWYPARSIRRSRSRPAVRRGCPMQKVSGTAGGIIAAQPRAGHRCAGCRGDLGSAGLGGAGSSGAGFRGAACLVLASVVRAVVPDAAMLDCARQTPVRRQRRDRLPGARLGRCNRGGWHVVRSSEPGAVEHRMGSRLRPVPGSRDQPDHQRERDCREARPVAPVDIWLGRAAAQQSGTMASGHAR